VNLGNNWPAAKAFGSNSFDPSVFTGAQVFFAEMLVSEVIPHRRVSPYHFVGCLGDNDTHV
jgi:hypothetical protein